MKALIGFGANLGPIKQTFERARHALSGLGTVLGTAPEYLSLPVGPEQPLFINSAVLLESELPSECLLEGLHRIEAEAGRERRERWGPRTLDLDLLFYGSRVCRCPRCVLPHPEVWNRDFALGPAAVVAPDFVDPVSGLRLAELMRGRSGNIMELLSSKRDVRAFRKRTEGRIAFVPTMGALHEGHLSLIRRARELGDVVLCSIFVNPLQFGPSEDLARYPRDPEGDRRKLLELQVDALFQIDADAMYASGHETYVVQEHLPALHCGRSRPGHFRGVMTVVTKLLLLVAPQVMVLGRKDYQQAAILRRMVTDLDLPVEVEVAPTVREADGLALSSRNAYLADDERRQATRLSAALFACESSFGEGRRSVSELLAVVDRVLGEAPDLAVEYRAIVDPEKLLPREDEARVGDLVLLAGRLGRTRLIDNRQLGAPPDPIASRD